MRNSVFLVSTVFFVGYSIYKFFIEQFGVGCTIANTITPITLTSILSLIAYVVIPIFFVWVSYLGFKKDSNKYILFIVIGLFSLIVFSYIQKMFGIGIGQICYMRNIIT